MSKYNISINGSEPTDLDDATAAFFFKPIVDDANEFGCCVEVTEGGNTVVVNSKERTIHIGDVYYND